MIEGVPEIIWHIADEKKNNLLFVADLETIFSYEFLFVHNCFRENILEWQVHVL